MSGISGIDPAYRYTGYGATELRAPARPLIPIRPTPTELSGPMFGEEAVGALDFDLTRQHSAEPLGQRIIVSGRVLDERGEPLAGALVEIWQANAAGRYAHPADDTAAPLDPNFSGGGRCLAAEDGCYRFVTIHPGAYPWKNHANAWRPSHIHFSVFGRSFAQRLITQMYFPGDPLLAFDPILQSVPEHARERLVARFDFDVTEPGWALGYSWDIVLRGPAATPGGLG